MFLQLIFLTLALSIDSLGIGVSYGIRKIKFKPFSFLIISLISLIISSVSLYFGNIISMIFSEKMASFISILMLIILGLFIIKKGIEKNDTTFNLDNKSKKYSCFIKFLGITINIIKTPSSCDFDNSKKIEPKEAFYLGLALSIDCIGVGIAISSLKIYENLFPFFIMFFQLLFLSFGMFIGNKLNFKKIEETKLSILSGIILIFIGFLRILFN